MADIQPNAAAEAPTFQDVWALIQQISKENREMSRETDRRFQETDRQMKETDRQMKETDQQMKETDRRLQETDRQMKETYRAIREAQRIVGNLGNKLGIVVEHLVLTNMKEKFNDLGYNFSKMVTNVIIEDKENNIMTEVDAMLENGEYALAIEVKTQLNVNHVDEHIERMEKLRRFADYRRDSRKFLGAAAGAIVSENVRTYALKKGFYVIQQSGDTVAIVNPADFKPKEW
jgi:hypothetical protein